MGAGGEGEIRGFSPGHPTQCRSLLSNILRPGSSASDATGLVAERSRSTPRTLSCTTSNGCSQVLMGLDDIHHFEYLQEYQQVSQRLDVSLLRLGLTIKLTCSHRKWLQIFYFVLLVLLGHDKISSLIAPLCHLPMINQCSHCVPSVLHFSPDFPKLASLQVRFESVMEESISNSIVAIDLKCSELAVQDL